MRHHKEVWKWKFNLIFISIQLSEMHGTREVKSDKISAKCKVCRTLFKLSAMCKSALMDYSDAKKQSVVKKMKTFLPVPAANISSLAFSQSAQQSLDSFIEFTFCLYSLEIVTEIIWALNTVSSLHSVRSGESIVDFFKKVSI